MEGKKYDKGKLRWDIFPLEQVEKGIEIMMQGMDNYGLDNWRGLEDWRIYNALMRHIQNWKKGEKIDSESGKTHLAHALVNVVFLMWKEDNQKKEGE